MTSPFVKSFSTAYKRARSQDSPTPLASPPVQKATKIEEEENKEQTPKEEPKVPAFLRQSQNAIKSKFADLAWKEQIRIYEGRSDPSSPWSQETGSHVKKRNRYNNVQPWEKSRIHLKVAAGKSDYINASPISLNIPHTGVDINYIATQGPRRSDTSHFWQMIWQETTEVAVIIMLTQTHDGGIEKCFQYFPLNAEAGSYSVDAVDESQGTPAGSVSFVETTSEPGSKIEIRRLCLRFGDETRDVWHLFFAGWADFAVPENEDRVALLELLRLSAEKNGDPKNPRIIHCSAGVGRSGTFIALEYLLAQVESDAISSTRDDEDVIYNVVNRLREQRMTMVQNDKQYQFLYDVVKEELQRKKAAVESNPRSSKLHNLASGMEATLIGESETERESSDLPGTDQIQIDKKQQEENTNGQPIEAVKDAC